MTAKETPKRIAYRKKAGNMNVVIVHHVDFQKQSLAGYCVWCKIGDKVTSGPLVEKVKAQMPKPVVEQFPLQAVMTLRPVKYKIQGTLPDVGKTITV